MKKGVALVCVLVLSVWCFGALIGGSALKEEREIYEKTLRLHTEEQNPGDFPGECQTKREKKTNKNIQK